MPGRRAPLGRFTEEYLFSASPLVSDCNVTGDLWSNGLLGLGIHIVCE